VPEELRRDVEEAIEDARRLAERIHVPLELGGLAVALRAAAASAGTPATVDVAAGPSYPDVVARTVYLCWLEALDATADEEPAIRVREEDGMVSFELSAGAGAVSGLERLRDRVEALGGGLEVDTDPTGGLRASGSLPF
jgi:signal transduction histidine kinase